MEKKKSFSESLEVFFAGKGFYIVLFLCVTVIGVSAWSMLAGSKTDVEPIGEVGLSDYEESVVTGVIGEPEIVEANAGDFEPDIPVSVTEPVEEEVSAPVEEEPAVTVSQTQSPAPVTESVPGYFVRPVSGEVENPWSMEALQYNRTMQDWRTHDGIDIAAELGAHVKAAADGIVEEVFNDDLYGTTVVISHSGGLKSIYSNLAETPTVSVGDAVAAGSVIGSVGDTALCETGEVTHLHFAMSLDGESVDPSNYLP